MLFYLCAQCVISQQFMDFIVFSRDFGEKNGKCIMDGYRSGSLSEIYSDFEKEVQEVTFFGKKKFCSGRRKLGSFCQRFEFHGFQKF